MNKSISKKVAHKLRDRFLLSLIIFLYFLFIQLSSNSTVTYSYLVDTKQVEGSIKAANVIDYIKVVPGYEEKDKDKTFTLINLSQEPIEISYEILGELSEVVDYKADGFILLPDKEKIKHEECEAEDQQGIDFLLSESVREKTYTITDEIYEQNINQEEFKNEILEEFTLLAPENVAEKTYPLVKEVVSFESINNISENLPKHKNYYRLKLHLKVKSNSEPGIYDGKLAILVDGKFLRLEIPISITIENKLRKTVIESSYISPAAEIIATLKTEELQNNTKNSSQDVEKVEAKDIQIEPINTDTTKETSEPKAPVVEIRQEHDTEASTDALNTSVVVEESKNDTDFIKASQEEVQ